jgi:hypothetical protein
MTWFHRQRIEWILETLRIFEFINRDHLMRKFGISQPQASKDLATFARSYPDVMAYDASRKCYVLNGDHRRNGSRG